MDSLKNIMDNLGLYISLLGSVQNYVYHNQNKHQDEKFHASEMAYMVNSQSSQMKEVKRTYLMSSYNDMERHFQQLNSDLINGSREFEKDMVDQRTLWCNTIIIASTIMLTALINVLIQGLLPNFAEHEESDFLQNIYIAYAISNAGSTCFLFLTIVLYIEVVSRVSKFNIGRARTYRYILAEALQETTSMLNEIRPTATAALNNHNHNNNKFSSSSSTNVSQQQEQNEQKQLQQQLSSSSSTKLTTHSPFLSANIKVASTRILRPSTPSHDPISVLFSDEDAVIADVNTTGNDDDGEYKEYHLNESSSSRRSDLMLGRSSSFRYSEGGIYANQSYNINTDTAINSIDLIDSTRNNNSNTNQRGAYRIPSFQRTSPADAANETSAANTNNNTNSRNRISNLFKTTSAATTIPNQNSMIISARINPPPTYPPTTNITSKANKSVKIERPIKNPDTLFKNKFQTSHPSSASLSAMAIDTNKSVFVQVVDDEGGHNNQTGGGGVYIDMEGNADPYASNNSSNSLYNSSYNSDNVDIMSSLNNNVDNRKETFSSATQAQSQQQQQNKYVSSNFNSSLPRLRKQIALLSENEIDIEFRSHESKIIHKFMEQRDDINDVTAQIFSNENSFEVYWTRYCGRLDHIALIFFYIGTALMLVAVSLYMLANYAINFKAMNAGVLAVLILVTSFFMSLALKYHFKTIDTYEMENPNDNHDD